MTAECRRPGFDLICRFQTVAVRTLYITLCKLRQRLVESFKIVPWFQVYFRGLGTQLWTLEWLDAKLDNEVQITYTRLRTKISETILPAFKECLQPADYAFLCKWIEKRGNTNSGFTMVTTWHCFFVSHHMYYGRKKMTPSCCKPTASNSNVNNYCTNIRWLKKKAGQAKLLQSRFSWFRE